MAASSTVSVKFLGDSRNLEKAAQRAHKSLGAFGVAAGIGIAAAARGLARFGEESVKAFADAEKSQMALQDAFARFPKLADRSYKSMSKYNQALAKKTRFDDDAIASAQALLARFELTGKQLEDLTPLVLDYAAATGKTAEDAASLLGKAMLGNTRALKTLGIDYKLTGDKAKDYAAIQALVTEKVGGFAEKEGKTAAGQLDILKNQFGELKETVGEYLLPVLTGLVKIVNDYVMPALVAIFDWLKRKLQPQLEKLGDVFRDEVLPRLKDFGKWVDDHTDDIQTIAKAFAAAAAAVLSVVAAVKTVNAVVGIVTLFANPWLLALAAIGLVAGAIAYLAIEGPKGVEKIRAAFDTAFTWLRDEGWPRLRAVLVSIGEKLLAWWNDPEGGGKFRAGLIAAVNKGIAWMQANAGKFGAKVGEFLSSAMLAAGIWVSTHPDKIVRAMAYIVAALGVALGLFMLTVANFFKNLALGGFNGFKDKLVELIKGFGGWLRDQFVLHVNWSSILTGSGRSAASGFWSGFKEKLSGLFSGNWMPSVPGFGGGRAAGGPVLGGRAYIVGERGPELFLPGRSGAIVPNSVGPAGGIVININGPVTDPVAAARWMRDAVIAGRRAGVTF